VGTNLLEGSYKIKFILHMGDKKEYYFCDGHMVNEELVAV